MTDTDTPSSDTSPGILDLWSTVAAARAAFLDAIEDVSEADALRPRPDEPGGW